MSNSTQPQNPKQADTPKIPGPLPGAPEKAPATPVAAVPEAKKAV